MAFSIGGFLAALHRIVPPGRAADWDISGLQLGDADRLMSRVGVCHEVTEEVVTRVVEDRIDLLVTYHPLLFDPTTRIVAGRSPVGRAFRLLSAGVALAVAHTSFDAVAGGTADSLADALGLFRTRSFAPVVPAGQVKIVTFVPPDHVEPVATAMSDAGAGRIGNYSGCSFRTDGIGAFLPEAGSSPVVGETGRPMREAEVRIDMIAPVSARDRVCSALAASHPYDEPPFDVYEVKANLGFIGRVGAIGDPVPLSVFADRVKIRLGADGVRVSGAADAEVSHVAVLPGSGGSFVAGARAAGADVLVTGDVGHHTMIRALDSGLAVIDVGHAPSERPGVESLTAIVKQAAEDGSATWVDLTTIDPTPWR